MASAPVDIQTRAARGKIPTPPKFDDKFEEREYLKFRLAQAVRIFGNRGYDEGLAGHITVRDPVRPDCFWVNPLGLHFKLVQPEDLLLVNHAGEILEHGDFPLLNMAAFLIHSAIHAARPDVLCAAHAHSTYGKAFSTLGKPLDMITQDACAFHNDLSVYKTFNTLVRGDEEGIAIAKALGPNKAVILQNHGLLVATSSVEASLHFYIALEHACKVQMLADSAAAVQGTKPVCISDEETGLTGQLLGAARTGWGGGTLEFMVLERQEGVKFQRKTPVE